MAESLTPVLLHPRSDDWDDLTELLEHLGEYHGGSDTELYAIVQALAEGRDTSMRVAAGQLPEFVLHMREFRIEATPKP